jgi:hypothetical protein
MAKSGKGGGGAIGGVVLTLALAGVALAATNPDEDQFRSVMRSQDKILLDVASLLPIERQNYGVFSRFEIKYGVGSTVCWGAAVTVFICPQNDANKAPIGIKDHGVAKG